MISLAFSSHCYRGEVTGLCYGVVMEALLLALFRCWLFWGQVLPFHWEFPCWTTFRDGLWGAFWGSCGSLAIEAGAFSVDEHQNVAGASESAPRALFGLEGIWLRVRVYFCPCVFVLICRCARWLCLYRLHTIRYQDGRFVRRDKHFCIPRWRSMIVFSEKVSQ